MNGDSIIPNIGGTLQGYNTFAYCDNNPVNFTDSTGYNSTNAFQWWASTMRWLPAMDSVLPAGDAIYVGVVIVLGVIALSTVAIPNAYSSPYSKTKTKPKTDTKEKEKDVAKRPPDTLTLVYRYGIPTPSNFVPSEFDVKNNSGLSFSTKPPRPGQKAAVTTIEALNATGIVRAYQDKPGHVRVDPVTVTLEEWRAGGTTHPCTTAVLSVINEWN